MAKKKTKERSAHRMIHESKYRELEKWVIAVLCTTIDQHALTDPTIYDRLAAEIRGGEQVVDDLDMESK